MKQNILTETEMYNPLQKCVLLLVLVILLILHNKHSSIAAHQLVLVSQNKTATQISTQYNRGANLAVDGNREQRFSYQSCTHTKGGNPDPHWWKVDLHQQYVVGLITIFNRLDCCTHRMQNVTILASLDDVQYSACHQWGNWFALVVNVTHNCTNQLARWIKIEKRTNDGMILCEVEVYAIGECSERERDREMVLYCFSNEVSFFYSLLLLLVVSRTGKTTPCE